MLIIYNSGRFRMAGRGSLSGLLSYGDANQIVVEMGYEVLPVVSNTPVLAGVCGTDHFRVMEIYLKQLKDMGLTTKGTIGAKTALTLDECVKTIKDIIKAGKEVNPEIMVICHGGPIAEPDDAQYVINRIPEVDGFFGASSIERFATENGIKAQTAVFKAIER